MNVLLHSLLTTKFNEWFKNEIEQNIDPSELNTDCRVSGMSISVGNFELDKLFDNAISWNELKATFDEMSLFFHVEQDEVEEIKKDGQ